LGPPRRDQTRGVLRKGDSLENTPFIGAEQQAWLNKPPGGDVDTRGQPKPPWTEATSGGR